MKKLKQLFPRLFRSPGARRGKKGSSLALVMMIGAALVIWVMCIMPLMSTTGSAAYKTQAEYDNYLLSRSAIEYCKSELEKIVEEKIPYTFAVTGDLDSGFTVVPKWQVKDVTVYSEYDLLVEQNTSLPIDDRLDVPSSSDVVAICAVEENISNPNIYDIVITTFQDTEPDLVYNAQYRPKGNLMINPESYKRNQALPLSDFVVVDGKMGANKVWDSTITMSKVEKSQSFTETLLPWIAPSSSEWHEGYANTGEYPCVFKMTANAASDANVNISDPVTMGHLSSSEHWIEPIAGTSSQAGNIWYSPNGDTLDIYMFTTENVNITEDCTIYINGKVAEDRKIPAHGVYSVSVDYKGTDYSTPEHPSKYDDSKINVLPKNGLHLNGQVGQVSTNVHTLDENISIEAIEKIDHTNDKGEITSTTYTVTLSCPADDLVYGISDAEGNVTWSTSNVFEGLSNAPGTAYFFYACRPASYENGVFYADSPVKSADMLFVPKFVSSLSSGSKYAIFGQADGTDYALNREATLDAISYEVGGFIQSGSDLSYYTWTATSSNNSWTFQNSGNQYLRINATPEPQYTTETINNHRTWTDWGGHKCTKFSCTSCNWSFTVGTGTSLSYSVTNSGTDFTVSYAASHTAEYMEYKCDSRNNQSKKFSTTAYLTLTDTVSASESASTVRFMQMPPAAPNVTSPSGSYTIGDTVTYGVNILGHAGSSINGAELEVLYANGQEVRDYLNVGSYHMVAKIKRGELATWVNLGILNVDKANLDASEMIVTAVHNESDELQIDVSASGWHNNGGIRYFGYRKAGESTYNWFASNDSEFAFRFEYGTYEFAVRETGNNNFNGTEAIFDGSVTLEPKFVSSDKININDFIYTFDKTSKEVVWYRLPDEITPLRVTLVYGYYWEGWTLRGYKQSLYWSQDYHGDEKSYVVQGTSLTKESHEHVYYGVIISGTDYYDIDHVFKIPGPVNINTINGHTSSMMRGSSLYFMNANGSINTFGSDVYLTTDLLVLNSDILGGGHVIVEPYRTGEGTPGNTMLYISNPSGITRNGSLLFEGRNFYLIPANTDLCNLNAGTVASWKLGDKDNEDVQFKFRQNIYPEINLDIAFADPTQLSRIINSETIGWTHSGVLSGSDSDSNPQYAITAYITGMNGASSYKANRILIAANTGSSRTLDVSSNLTLTTRYLSVDADQIVGDGATSFILYDMGQDADFAEEISKGIGLTNFRSKTLQMDYERATLIKSGSVQTPIDPMIYRYDDGTDILRTPTNMALMSEYTTTEIEELFNEGFFDKILGGILGNLTGATVQTVDRYASLKADNDEGVIEIKSRFSGNNLNIFANYLYVDSSVKTIKLTSEYGSNDITINTQESGYTTKEYLGLFTQHISETYTGTILYFAGKVYIVTDDEYTINPGFYYVEASQGSTSLSVLAKNPEDYRISLDELRKLSIYIKADGTLAHAYVDTGLLDDSAIGDGGFYGGNVG